MASSKNNDRLSYGITILIFGLLFLLQKTGILAQIPYGENFISVGTFFLIAGIVFVATQPKRVLGWVFACIGLFLNADFFFGWMTNYSRYIVPLALIIAGIVMVFSASNKK